MAHDDDVVDGEVVGELEGNTLMNLPSVDDNAGDMPATPPPAAQPYDDDVDQERRGFMRRLVIGGLAALGLGGGAAVAINVLAREEEPQVVVLPNGADVTGENAASINQLAERITELEAQLVAVQAERDQLISQNDALQRERDSLAADLAECENLLTLWEQHHNVGLDNVVSSALTLMAPMVVALIGLTENKLVPALGKLRATFASFLAALPSPTEGIQWLAQKVVSLNERLLALRERVTEAVDPVDQFTDLITDFVFWVLDRLPFGAGDQARAGLEAMRNTINILPEFVEGLEGDVLDPLAEWFGDDEDQNLRGTLLTPTVDTIFDPLDDLIADLTDFRDTFTTAFREPVEDALAERETLRTEINQRTEAYRQGRASA